MAAPPARASQPQWGSIFPGVNATVAVVRCASYEQPLVDAAVRRAADLLGGMGQFVRAGERIVLKPNVLYGAAPEKCITTHPSILTATARLALAQGATVTYGDSSAVLSPGHNLRRAGLSAAGEALGLRQADFETPVSVVHPKALLAHQLVLAKGALEADGLVSLAKLKTHNLTRLTGAVKNQYGCVPGMAKGRYHAQYPDVRDFCKLLVDITTRLRPRLYVMDAVMAMEGNGPGSGQPRNLGVILVSSDPVALDTVACRLVDMPPECVPTIALGEQAGLGTAQWENITLTGDPLDPLIDRQFDAVRLPPVPLGRGRVRRALKELLTPRPVIRAVRCVRCGRCVDVCPVSPKAVDWGAQGRQAPPVHSYSRCIRCFCCNEVCPEKAVDVVTPWLGRMLPPLAFLSLLATRIRNALATPGRRTRGRR